MTPPDPMGPFFAIQHLVEAPTASSGWRPLGRDLADPVVVDAWIGRAWWRVGGGGAPTPAQRRALGAVLHLGVMARVTSPWIARFLLDGDPRVPELGVLWWRDDGTTMFPLALVGHGIDASDGKNASDVRGVAPSPGEVVETFTRHLVNRVVRTLDDSGFVPSAAIRRGNAASAINTAAGLVVRQAGLDGEGRDRGRAVVEGCLRLLGEDVSASSGVARSRTFRRTSCCLAYALPTGRRDAVCGDCVLRP